MPCTDRSGLIEFERNSVQDSRAVFSTQLVSDMENFNRAGEEYSVIGPRESNDSDLVIVSLKRGSGYTQFLVSVVEVHSVDNDYLDNDYWFG